MLNVLGAIKVVYPEESDDFKVLNIYALLGITGALFDFIFLQFLFYFVAVVYAFELVDQVSRVNIEAGVGERENNYIRHILCYLLVYYCQPGLFDIQRHLWPTFLSSWSNQVFFLLPHSLLVCWVILIIVISPISILLVISSIFSPWWSPLSSWASALLSVTKLPVASVFISIISSFAPVKVSTVLILISTSILSVGSEIILTFIISPITTIVSTTVIISSIVPTIIISESTTVIISSIVPAIIVSAATLISSLISSLISVLLLISPTLPTSSPSSSLVTPSLILVVFVLFVTPSVAILLFLFWNLLTSSSSASNYLFWLFGYLPAALLLFLLCFIRDLLFFLLFSRLFFCYFPV